MQTRAAADTVSSDFKKSAADTAVHAVTPSSGSREIMRNDANETHQEVVSLVWYGQGVQARLVWLTAQQDFGQERPMCSAGCGSWLTCSLCGRGGGGGNDENC